ncbi:prepilin peptidase [Sandaracinus amylolyticus]|uniref:Prepilin leader peptidase/N-methyltransferase n=1 Tax=Sandaracinus amylolyticus TaxID=927083 RepID=A0A0F6W3U9_9BACT|nr:A24 family peptidase [Sandaracinus amylolyticus]AKF06787.1 Leader peptidase (Prepilin peptidase) [Sandaracinus amylolyticus]
MLASELPAWIARLVAFVFGALWGSFFNVAIYRWPREMSVVSPPSHCPACGKPIPGWRNVPLLAYLLQRGKAGCCGARMTPRYFLVELLSAVIAVAIAERFVVNAAPMTELGEAAIETLLWFVFAGGLIIATFVDLEWMEIPDEVSIGGTALALATATWRPSVPLEEVVLGAGAGFLVVQLLLVWSWERLTGERGMGEGDSKLAMYIGAFLGWRGALFALVAGSFQGIVAWAIARAAGAKIGPSADHSHEEDVASTKREGEAAKGAEEGDEEEDAPSRRIPFGPFLALGAIEFLFFGGAIVDWYLSFFE